MSEENAVELYRRYRPTKLSEVVGQDSAVQILKGMGKRDAIPHFILLTGPSGCGKTTIARILRNKLGCSDVDFTEMNAAQDRGIDMVRDIKNAVSHKPLAGECRLWLIDEAAQLTVDAQAAFLKELEDIDDWVYFIFCTTDPQKLKPTIKTRATTIQLKSVGTKDLEKLVQRVAKAETDHELSEDVVDLLVDAADGSPRKALVLLGEVIGLSSDKMVEALEKSVPAAEAIELCRELIQAKSSWANIRKILNGIEGLDEQVEGIRWLVLSYMTSVLLKGGSNSKAAEIIHLFKEPFYNSKKAGLVLACCDVCNLK